MAEDSTIHHASPLVLENVVAVPSSFDLNESSLLATLTEGLQSSGLENTVEQHLGGLPNAQKVVQVVDIFNLFQEHNESLEGVVRYIWERYVLPQKLWEYYDGGEAQFKQNIAYDRFIAPVLVSASASEMRKAQLTSRLESKWGAGWERAIVLNSSPPPRLSEHFLANMAKLASKGMALPVAVEVLTYVVKARVSHPRKGIRNQQSVMVSDIQKVCWALGKASQFYSIEAGECSALQLIGHLQMSESSTHALVPPGTVNSLQNASLPSTVLSVGETSQVFPSIYFVLSCWHDMSVKFDLKQSNVAQQYNNNSKL